MDITRQGDGVRLRLAGRLDASTVPSVEKALTQAVAENQAVTVDCGEVSFVSSSGLRILLVAAKAMKARGRTLRLAGLRENVRHMISLAGMQAFFDMSTSDCET